MFIGLGDRPCCCWLVLHRFATLVCGGLALAAAAVVLVVHQAGLVATEEGLRLTRLAVLVWRLSAVLRRCAGAGLRLCGILLNPKFARQRLLSQHLPARQLANSRRQQRASLRTIICVPYQRWLRGGGGNIYYVIFR